jgi:hypothetical protein
MNRQETAINDLLRAHSVSQPQSLQSLWSGYGEITRYSVSGADVGSVVVKRIAAEPEGGHPRGWNTNLSHQRKLRSYQVEVAWYRRWAQECSPASKVPHCYGVLQVDDQTLIVLEDLDGAGFNQRKSHLNLTEVKQCLHWLAHFHGRFMQSESDDLWPVGTYWHLATRPDELAAMNDGALKSAAAQIDQALNQAKYKTLVHGDAKVANFCFAVDQVAAVDFQYVGGGCGIKDVAYFLGSCLTEQECEHWQDECLQVYFTALRQGLEQNPKPCVQNINFSEIEREWRYLYPMAWADFQRFL